MGIVLEYLRGPERVLREMVKNDRVAGRDTHPAEVASFDIDKDYAVLAWFASARRRAEDAYNTRLMNEPDWPDDEIAAAAAVLDRLPVETALLAIEGRIDDRLEPVEVGLGGFLIPPAHVATLSRAVQELDADAFRARIDPVAMNRDDIGGADWEEDAEEMMELVVVPGLRRLQHFYDAASRAGEAVLLSYC